VDTGPVVPLPQEWLINKTSPQEYMFWNASTGRFYEQRDSLSPFQSVGALVNEENVWFNIQADEAPARVRFDVSSFSNNERRRDSFQG